MIQKLNLNKQEFRNFTIDENHTWSLLFNKLDECRKSMAHHFFLEGIQGLDISQHKIPDINKINSVLSVKTGWSVVPVKGLEEGPSFYTALSQKHFPIGNFIRDQKNLGYTPEPDIFHDLYGHVPFLFNNDYADFSFQFGQLAAQFVSNPEKLQKIERFYWFTLEFGLIKTNEGNRIFGGGILSSYDESYYSLSDKPKVLPFNVKTIVAQDFRIDQIQPVLFLIESLDQLYSSLEEVKQSL
ncbi:MAG: phenylalanine 4-monooxygenase [Bdellovibrionales bacterium]|nr:phenylalanine 4-monooxygenase [Bdellovibrionales bacterium]